MRIKNKSRKLKICKKCEHFNVHEQRQHSGYGNKREAKVIKRYYSCDLIPPDKKAKWWISYNWDELNNLPRKAFCKQEPPEGCPYSLEIMVIEQGAIIDE